MPTKLKHMVPLLLMGAARGQSNQGRTKVAPSTAIKIVVTVACSIRLRILICRIRTCSQNSEFTTYIGKYKFSCGKGAAYVLLVHVHSWPNHANHKEIYPDIFKTQLTSCTWPDVMVS